MTSSAPLPSNRSFGTLFVVVFAVVGGFIWWRGGGAFGWWFSLSGLTLLVTLAKPDWLTPANRAWMKLAEILNRIVSPIVLGVMFYGLFAPIGWAMRLAGRDVLKRQYERSARSYWVERAPPGPDPTSFKNQF
jgi:Saxitoxin biosynthesis operon protein SxtJ